MKYPSFLSAMTSSLTVLFNQHVFFLTVITFLNAPTSLAAITDSRQAAFAESFSLGLHIHHAGDTTPWPTVQFENWRLWDAYVQWPDLQPARRVWRFGLLDELVDLAEQHEVSILLPLGLTPLWASARPAERSAYGAGKAAEPANMDYWVDYVRTIGLRYKGRIRDFEIWNEPNDKSFFSGSTHKLVELTCAAAKILKEIDPQIRIASPAYTGAQNLPRLDEFLSIGGAKCIDIVAYHFYWPDRPPEVLPELIHRIRNVMASHKLEHLPLWNTESGWAIENQDGTPIGSIPEYWLRLSADESAMYVSRALLLSVAMGVGRFYWYAWDNRTMGLIEPQEKVLKPGATAMEVVGRWIENSNSIICTPDSEIWVCVLSSSPARIKRLVVWATGGPQQYNIPEGWKLAGVQTALGTREPIEVARTTLFVDGLPRLLEFTTSE